MASRNGRVLSGYMSRVNPHRLPVLMVAALLVTAATTIAITAGSALSRRLPRPVLSTSVSTARDPWAAYETSVLPGGGVQLASARVGFTLSGEPTNGFDENLSAPAGIILAWPSPSVLVTRDGARRWTRSLSVRGGFWGVDALDSNHVWAVGVTGLYRTVNGGARWQRAAEPGKALVRVAFASPTTGFGLTLTGQLVESQDSGSSWRASRWAGHGAALCAPKPGVVVVADQDGGIWRSGNTGGSWRQVAAGLAQASGFSAWYTDLSCQGSNAVELSQAFCTNTVGQCGTELLSRVRQTTDRALAWRLIVSQSAADPEGGGVHTQPASALDVPLDRAVAAGAVGLCLLGYPFVPPASAEISCTAHAAEPYRRATLPRLPFPASKSSVVLQGVDFLNAKIGWLLLDEYTAAATPSQSNARTEIWSTHDGGRAWSATYISPSYHGSWCSKLHTSVCWRSPFSTSANLR